MLVGGPRQIRAVVWPTGVQSEAFLETTILKLNLHSLVIEYLIPRIVRFDTVPLLLRVVRGELGLCVSTLGLLLSHRRIRRAISETDLLDPGI